MSQNTSFSELYYSEVRYRRLFEAARDGILIVDPVTRRIVDVNPFLIEFLGYRHDEFVGRELFEIGLLKDEAASQAAFLELQLNGYIRYENLPLQTKSGHQVDVEFVSNIYSEGDEQIIQCNIRDISARKRAESALRESEERFKLVARAVSDAIWDWDLVTNQRWWSDGFLTTFGYSISEIEPGIESWTSRIHPDERQHVVDSIRQTIDSAEQAWAAEYRFRRKDGNYAFVRDSGHVLRNRAGVGIRMVGGMRDYTEQKQAEAQYLRAQRMENIGTLAGGIAHDLNNVLTPILLSIELLKSSPGDDPKRYGVLDSIALSCQRGADLVHQVLAFARGADGERKLVDVQALFADLQGIISETFPRDITITTEADANLWPVSGDPTQLHHVLLNLAVNARDAMPAGGQLILTASNIMVDPQYAGTSREAAAGRHVMIEVRDTGLGIPLAIRDRIFEPFFTTKDIGKGTGLGLATVFAIIKNHGGFITVDSEIGTGSSFKLYLPTGIQLATGNTPVPIDISPHRGNGELVLVVDDEPAIRLVTQRTLEAFGYRVVSAEDGAQAIAIYANQTQQISLVITDMMMPVLDGAAAIKVLMRINPLVKIIAISGLEVAENIAKLVATGALRFLSKPFSALTLLRLVNEELARPVAGSAR